MIARVYLRFCTVSHSEQCAVAGQGGVRMPVVRMRDIATACIMALRHSLPAASWRHVSAVALAKTQELAAT